MVKRTAKIRSRPVKTGSRALPYFAVLTCADNTGAQRLRLIAVKGYKGRRKRYPKAGVGNMVNCSVIKGSPEMRKQVVQAIIIRQRKEYTRADGSRIKFADNAAVITTPDGDLKGTDIKGPVAREAVNKWPGISGAARMVV